MNPRSHRVYSTARDTNRLYVLDGMKVIGYAGGDREPCGVAVNPDSNKAYVANFGSGDVYVLDATTLSLRTSSRWGRNRL